MKAARTLPWLEVLDEAIRSCAAHDRADLVRRLRARRVELTGEKVRVLVLGESKQGKSQLLNGLLGTSVCAVGDGLTTTVPAVLEHAPSPVAALVPGDPVEVFDPGSRHSLVLEAPASMKAASAALRTGDRVPAEADSATADGNLRAGIAKVEIGLPRKLLETGLTLIDTPPYGVDGGDGVRVALAALSQADAVLLTSDATRDFTPSELDVLDRVLQVCPNAAVVLTKIDLVPGWRHMVERRRARLDNRGLDVAMFPVSSALRLVATQAGDPALNDESGFPALLSYLHHELMGNVDVLRRRCVGALSRLAVDSLSAPLLARLAELRQESDGELVARYRSAGRRLERLQRESARWQTMLADDVTDLTADLDFDLRDRTRRILREADEYFDKADPAREWPAFEEWLLDNLRSVAEANSGWLLDRFEWIAQRLADAIALRRPDSFIADSLAVEPPVNELDDLKMPNIERFTLGQKLFVGMRGSYSGLLMFGLATTLAGMDLINPISIGAGVAFGAKSVLEERVTRLKRRQAVAKAAAQRYVDDFFLAYGKASKDTVRLVQRELRDRCDTVAQELRTETSEAAARVKRAIETEAAERNSAMREVASRLEELELLRRRSDVLAPKTAARRLPA